MKILFLADFLPNSKLIFDDAFHALINEADKIVFNLEGSPLTGSSDDAQYQIMPFNCDDLLNFIEHYGKTKFIIALANNHILDNGFNGFDYLIQKLVDNNIEFFGTKSKPFINIGNEVVILNFLTAETVAKYNSSKRISYLFYNTKAIASQIKEIEKMPYIPIMYPHWGRDMDTTVFKTYKLKFDNSRWFVFGHHPHVISGIADRSIYSMGNTFIPHPNYYINYPSMRYGLAIMFNSVSVSYNKFITKVTTNDHYIADFRLTCKEFNVIPDEVLENGKNFGALKKTFLNVFAFTGSFVDLIRLIVLQFMSVIFKLKVRNLKQRSHE